MAADRFLWIVTTLTLLLCKVGSVESVLCYFNYIDYYTVNYTIRYEPTECTECCGDPGYEYCCWDEDDFIVWVIAVAVVSSIVLLTLIITITVCCTVKLTLYNASKGRRAPPLIHIWTGNQNRHTALVPAWCQATSEGSTNGAPLRSGNPHTPTTGDSVPLPPELNRPTNHSPNTIVDVTPINYSQTATTLPPV